MLKSVKDIIGRVVCYECEGCDIAAKRLMPAGGLIYEDENLTIYSHLSVPIKGYIVISPKEHVSFFHFLTDKENRELLEKASFTSDTLIELGVCKETQVVKIEGIGEHARIFVMPKIEGIDENFDFSLLESRYSMERRKIHACTPYEILYLNRKLKGVFFNYYNYNEKLIQNYSLF